MGEGTREEGGNFPQSRAQVTVVQTVSEVEGIGGPIRDMQDSENELVDAQQEDLNIQLLIQLKNWSEDSCREAELNPALVKYLQVWDQLQV